MGRVLDGPDVGDEVSGTGFSGCRLQHHAEQKDHTQRLSACPHGPQNMAPDTGGVQVQRSHWLARIRQKELNVSTDQQMNPEIKQTSMETTMLERFQRIRAPAAVPSGL